MAAITKLTTGQQDSYLLETIAIVNQTAASTAVSKAFAVPQWARDATLVIGNLTLAGTTPTFDFALYGADVKAGGGGIPDDGFIYLLTGWAGITQKTAATATTTTIDIGPAIAADTTGSATASDRYGIQSLLPRWLVYKYTTTDAADDADYSATITVYFK